MSLQNHESSYIQAVNARMNSAVPHRMEAVTIFPASFDEESVLYLDAAATVVFYPSGQGVAVSVSFAAGWIPVRAIAVQSVSAGNLYRAY